MVRLNIQELLRSEFQGTFRRLPQSRFEDATMVLAEYDIDPQSEKAVPVKTAIIATYNDLPFTSESEYQQGRARVLVLHQW